MKVREVIKTLEKAGWRTSRDHRVFQTGIEEPNQ
jgi:predicted RNA binding protein YcfA (HicA-like mRNA interferase family)